MKRYLTTVFIGLSAIVAILGINLDLYWSGVVAWGVAIVLLLIAIYCIKYIPDERRKQEK